MRTAPVCDRRPTVFIEDERKNIGRSHARSKPELAAMRGTLDLKDDNGLHKEGFILLLLVSWSKMEMLSATTNENTIMMKTGALVYNIP